MVELRKDQGHPSRKPIAFVAAERKSIDRWIEQVRHTFAEYKWMNMRGGFTDGQPFVIFLIQNTDDLNKARGLELASVSYLDGIKNDPRVTEAFKMQIR